RAPERSPGNSASADSAASGYRSAGAHGRGGDGMGAAKHLGSGGAAGHGSLRQPFPREAEKRLTWSAHQLLLVGMNCRTAAASLDSGMVCNQTRPGPRRVARNSPSPANRIFVMPFTIWMS